MHIFQRCVPAKASGFQLRAHGLEASDNCGKVDVADEALRRQHVRVRQAARDVMGEQALIKRHRRVERSGLRIEGARKAGAACTFGSVVGTVSHGP